MSADTDHNTEIVTRFAPSPTGMLHIGGARTALFNLLFARHHGGRFLLRIEDTDLERSTPEAVDAILGGLRWLDFAWDGGPVFQSANRARHVAVAHALVASGGAYRCWMSADELAAERAAAQAERRTFRLRSPWRDRDDGPLDRPHVIRLRAPREGAVTIDDRVQGAVTVQNEELDDFVLLRSDGTPTYMLAVVVDDADMGITHVIRGDDHLNNAFRQLALIRAAGFREPVYAHVPLIHGPDGAKLSKRHGAVAVESYRDILGILPEALENYLLRLGWGHGDDEIIAREQAVAWFDLTGIGRGAARTDPKKLEFVNKHYLRLAAPGRLVALTRPRIEATLGRALTDADLATLTALMPELGSRGTGVLGLADSALWLFQPRPLALDDKAAAQVAQNSAVLRAARAALAGAEWSLGGVEAALTAVAAAHNVGLGKVAQPLRAALTGTTTSPGIFDVAVALDQGTALGRIDDALAGATGG